ncbi:hypothetical protein AKJ62_02700 [candidate division MSBL1 archaeon SCGC-AAA259D14]|uniref:Cytochrome c assembly protein domain-containing protein n=1 Tax=candidate division MSBL1 archaeon SCGC-AAA259D14 TaxID=1698261 RepID=A0A133U605_9EURY|nr:hypothetical protein AKJ62_02700 [candidate division MSBL1 archaeon SCGC-AAA259D14]
MSENALLWVALALAGLSFGSSLLYIWRDDERFKRLSKYMLYISVFFVALAFVLLTYYFSISELSIEYVLAHTKVSYPLKYKIAGVWAGNAGAILLWTLITGLAGVVFDYFSSERRMKNIRPVFTAMFFAFILMVVKAGLFSPASEQALDLYPNGFGVKPLLTTDLMVVHPPLQFLGYGLTIIPFVAAISYLVFGREDWTDSLTLQFTRIAWLFYGLGLGVGALWAYQVLGWGGYWGWDPVETASLMGWLALTPLLHILKRRHDRNTHRFLAPVLAGLTFMLIMFSAFASRSGVLGGVHQFARGGKKGLVAIVSGNWILSNIVMILAVSTLLTVPLLVYRYSKEKAFDLRLPKIYLGVGFILSIIAICDVSAFTKIFMVLSSSIYPSNPFFGSILVFGLILLVPGLLVYSLSEGEEGELNLRNLIKEDNTILLTVGVLILGAAASLILLGMGAGGIENQAAFNSRMPYFTIPLALLLIICSTWRTLEVRKIGYIITAGFALGLATYGIFNDLGIHGFEIGFYIVAVAVPLFQIYSIGSRYSDKIYSRLSGLLLFVVGLLGIILWSSAPSVAWPFGGFTGFLPRFIMTFLSSIVLISAFSAYKSENRNFIILGTLLGVITFSYWVGAVLSVIALLFLLKSWNNFSSYGFSLSKIRSLLNTSSRHIIHIGLALLILGFVLSTFMSAQARVQGLNKNGEKSALGYDFRLLGSGGEAEGEEFEHVYAKIGIYEGGRLVDVGNVSMDWWTGGGVTPHMMEQVTVVSTLREDIYLIPSSFFTEADGWKKSMSKSKFSSSSIQAASFQVEVIPGMNAVWGGMWLMIVGVSVLIITDFFKAKKSRTEKIERWKKEYKEEILGG